MADSAAKGYLCCFKLCVHAGIKPVWAVPVLRMRENMLAAHKPYMAVTQHSAGLLGGKLQFFT
ncbi:hypothetical protein AA0481_2159 [Acetobacter orientalis NRIC 0481]|nr:hypothetical protein AA0481_2159 [Acetobacter orientalis NRIC 0481]